MTDHRRRAAGGPRPAVGTSIARKEGPEKVTGAALYVDDLYVPDMLYGATVRSTIPAGRILGIDLDPAFDWSDVTVVDHRDIPGRNVIALIEDDQPALAAAEVRHAEEPILLLAHPDREKLLAAQRAVSVRYEPFEPVLDLDSALACRRVLREPDNVFKEFLVQRGDVGRGLASAARVVERTYHTGHQEHVYIENNGVLAHVEQNGTVVVRGSLQCPYYVHKALAQLFGLPDRRVRVIQTVTGGGFGGKEEYPSMLAAHAALLARKAGRPVKMVYDRMEDMAATTKRHPAVVRHRAGVAGDGTLVALDIDVVMDAGAYLTLSSVVLSRGTLHAAGAYRCENVRIHSRAVATNTPPNGAFRGFGAPQTLFAMELQMDHLAEAVGLDPVELRRRNLYQEGDTMPTGQVLRESVGAGLVLDTAVRASGYARRRREIEAHNRRLAGRAAAAGPRRARGLGLSLVLHGDGFTGSGETKLASVAAVDLSPEGRPRVLAASTDIGQGTNTVFAQLAADALAVSPDLVEVAQPDTQTVPNSGPTVASRTVMVVGRLVSEAAAGLRDRLRAYEPRGWRDDRGFLAVARRYLGEHGSLREDRQYRQPAGVRWDDETYTGDAYAAYSWACNVVEVEVDLDTGEVRPVEVVAAVDVGRAVHPRLAEGQVEGGIAQALGYALLEEVLMQGGRMANQQLTNYIIPTTVDAPRIRTLLVETPYSGGPRGAKGVGELPMDGPAPAVLAAVRHATGVWFDRIPVTPERLLEALERGRRRARV
ncbi:MAG TPA: xanthine dehydrogenase family protein molybdopterin-binding subunit [Candidatus Saccharimonadales bacterium]|nr:xanthine dehydrogenase family protein molybdopterin-binding subunit [Candidatus Saccharimonadales bacterium]